MMFESIPTYNRYRTLYLTSPQLQGEDVFALQTALNELGFNCGEPDGILGPATSASIKMAQRALLLVTDGKAGGDTQKAVTLELSERVAVDFRVPVSALKGQLEFESGYRLGNYSPPRADSSYDAGVAQRNTLFTPPDQGFDTLLSIRALCQNTRKHYDLFEGLPTRRRWGLAQGAWNAPAYACYIAKEEGAFKVSTSMTARPSSAARQVFEDYVAHATVYLKV
jgi:hypothetical protein